MHTSSHYSKGRSDWNGGLSQFELKQASPVRTPEKILWKNIRTMNLSGKSPALQSIAIESALKINMEGMNSSGKSRNAIVIDCIDGIKEQLKHGEIVALSAWAIVEWDTLEGVVKEVMSGLSLKK